MANNKMLIDASHPEETRVVVVRGNRIEEFDFEAQERRQLRGNIYLAKVTRVEPSLQAAFIDYGGNRHGFLAFSEIHPDYYQIPAADRQALLEAEEAEASKDTDEDEISALEAAEEPNSDDDDEAHPKKRGRRKSRRGGRTRKAKNENENSDEGSEEASAETPTAENDATDGDANDAVKADEASADAPAEEEKPAKTPRKRTRRPKKAAAEKASDEADAPADGSETDASDESGKSMAAMMEMDSISEPAPEDEDGSDNSSDGEATVEEKPAPKKKTRRPTRRKSTKKAEAEEETTSESAPEEQKPVEAKKAEAESDSESTSGEDVSEDDKPKKSRKTSRTRKTSRKKAKPAEENSDGDDADASETDSENGDKVESVGQEDVLEEVPVRRPRRQYKIQEVVRRRQVMLVQVVKEERGNKGAALTTYLSLAGRYSVLMPNTARGGGISRKITNPGDRKRLKEIANSFEVPKGMGVILRTAGASRDKEEIKRDFEYLMRLWENVRNLTLESSAPFLVYEEGSLIKRSIRDLYNKDIGEIIVSGESGYAEATNFMNMMMPEHVKNVKYYQGEQSLLSKFNVESQLEKMVTPQVTLKSGGYLIINQTEALVAIDVNSGRSTREHSIEATALQTNLEAAEEVARQLRLRDLAGLVVIDFIDMEEKRNNRAVERKLKDCLKNDRARIQVGHISHFGLMEMSRQRIRASVLESTMAVCPVCEGVGHVRSESSFAIHVLRSIDDHLSRHSRFDVNVKVAPATAMFILNQKRQAVSELEDRYGVSIAFEGDFHMQVHEFALEKGAPATRTPAPQKAVNPMEFATEDAGSDTSDVSTDEEDRNAKRGKRRRGRGRNRGRDRDENANKDASSESEEAVSDADALADVESGSSHIEEVKAEEVAEAPEQERKPSRGRRPRKSKTEAKAEEPVSTPEKVADEKVTGDTVTDASSEAVVDESPAEPVRRTGRPGKKAKTEAAPVAEETPSEESVASSTGSNGAPPREVNRRNTKRVRKPKEETEASDTDEKPASFNDGFLS